MTEGLQIDITLVDEGMAPPTYAHASDAGADLCSAIDFTLEPFERRVVPTGIAIALPAGHAGFVHPRSGLSSRHGVTVVNAPGTIDSGYRGEVKVPLINLDPKVPMRISRGDRIAQLIIQEVRQADFRVVDSLDDSDRGAGGFGSTGGVVTGLGNTVE
ncbi:MULTISPECIES: dUTP diphosphatase [Brevibacterium]|uniref:Deoxyuridine 5'-triphosphate nucleotidohydrolase n=3 Tax=Brevibacterium casei TaxID=33889 RepID=K9AZ55_9MICO|nr:dUTP diphosphatase [Brevibacterium casei]NJE68175.1 dUTP diphosphatase [Brevibacterium sp. LS14]EKU47817.1 deoxyuridine 5'-triphosphate nucleotidohydrolase Dut [Brevibacterium casei S18]MBE4696069.1 dUTP diphosphatase [Brevibacterium casei]MBE8146420.1 dUTP diphosphatase [Brevibacterium casei]MBY3579191.1 dUTP diphosphatase [Brevibacterium casei]